MNCRFKSSRRTSLLRSRFWQPLSLFNLFGSPIAPPTFLLSSLLSPFLLFPLPPSPYPSPLLILHPSSLSRPLPAGLHPPHPFDGYQHLLACPVLTPFLAAWFSLLLTVIAAFKFIRPASYCPPPSYDSRLIGFISTMHTGRDMFLCSALSFGSGSPATVHFLLNVVAGIEGGRLQGIPWQSFPLI